MQQFTHRDTISDFVQRVDRACADLPDAQRRRILADLEAHLREMEARSDLLAELGDPEQYARDLRAAMDLPTPTAAAPARRRRWPVAIALAVALVAVVAALLVVHTGSTSKREPRPTASATTPQLGVQVPDLVGQPQTAAIAQAKRRGLTVVVQPVTDRTIRAGLVIAQMPAPYTRLSPGMRVTLRVSTG